MKTIIGFLLLISCINVAEAALKGRTIKPAQYAPAMGNVACQVLGGLENGEIFESYTEHSGKVNFYWKDTDHKYRLDIHASLKEFPTEQPALDEQLKHYFENDAMPLLLKNHRHGELEVSKPITNNDKRLYYGLFYYPSRRGGLSVAFEKTRPTYRAIVIYYHNGFVYTVTNTEPNSVYSQDLDESFDLHPEMLELALAKFNRCQFFEDVSEVKSLYPPVTEKNDIKINFSERVNESGEVDLLVGWEDKDYLPEAFIQEAIQWQVQNIYLPHEKQQWTKCVLAMADQIGAKVYWYWGAEGKIDEYQQVEGSFVVEKSCRAKSGLIE